MIFSVYKIESFALPLKVGLIMLFLTSLVILTICDYCRPIYRITVVVTIAATIMVTLYLIADKLGLIKYLKDFNTIKSVILSTGNFGIAVYLLLSICQVVFLPIPAACRYNTDRSSYLRPVNRIFGFFNRNLHRFDNLLFSGKNIRKKTCKLDDRGKDCRQICKDA